MFIYIDTIILVGGLNPSEKYESQLGWENKKCSKPPTSIYLANCVVWLWLTVWMQQQLPIMHITKTEFFAKPSHMSDMMTRIMTMITTKSDDQDENDDNDDSYVHDDDDNDDDDAVGGGVLPEDG